VFCSFQLRSLYLQYPYFLSFILAIPLFFIIIHLNVRGGCWAALFLFLKLYLLKTDWDYTFITVLKLFNAIRVKIKSAAERNEE